MARGDTVTVTVPGRAFAGPVVHVGSDLVAVFTAAGRVDLQVGAVAAALEVSRRPDATGSAREPGPSTFRSRLLELEVAGSTVTLGVPGLGVERSGRLAAVGADHVALSGGEAATFLPLAAIAYVIRR